MLRFVQILLVAAFARVLFGVVRMILLRPRAEPAGGPRNAAFRGEVIRCERCGLHAPAGRIVRAGGAAFCSDACRED